VWLAETQKFLPRPQLTVWLDIAPETAVQRKTADRDRYERDLALLARVRESYRRQAAGPGWVRIDGERSKDAVAEDVATAVASQLGLR
jgi:thymidylate kinase